MPLQFYQIQFIVSSANSSIHRNYASGTYHIFKNKQAIRGENPTLHIQKKKGQLEERKKCKASNH